MTYINNATANAAVGALGGGEGGFETDYRIVQQHVVDTINASGGLAGRQVVPVWFELDVTSAATEDGRQRETQRACSTFTEDNQVFAFSGMYMLEENILDCAADSRTAMVAVANTSKVDQARFNSMSPYWYGPHHFVTDRQESMTAKVLLAERFFGADAKVALVIQDQAAIRAGVERGMKPVLQAAGVDVVEEIVYPDFIESPWDTYVLRMRSLGVTHVVMSATIGEIWPSFFLMQASQNQRFYPQWGIPSDHGASGLAARGVPREQLENVLGVGWLPDYDIGQIGPPQSAATERCWKLVKDAGQPRDGDENLYCDFLFFLEAVFARVAEVSHDGFAAAVHELGTAYVSPILHDGATKFSPGQHGGTSMVRTFALFDGPCGEQGDVCFRYTSPPRPVPS